MEYEKARDLGAAYRAFELDPLRSPEALAVYYAPVKDTDFEHLYVALLNSDGLQPTQWLVTGHRGNGKSTEFHRLMIRLQEHYFSVYADAEEELDLYDIEPVDVLLLVGARVYAEARKAKINIPDKVIQKLFERVRLFTGAPEPDTLEGESTVEGKLNLVLAEFTVQLSKVFGQRKELRESLLSNYSELLQQFNELIQHVADAIQPRSLLVIVDSLDRLSREKALKIFHDSGVLRAIGCNVIYTPPVSIFYSDEFAQIREGFGGKTIQMPNIKTHTQTGEPHQEGQAILRQMVHNRIDESLIAQDALKRLVEVSGGLPRQLFTLAQHACLNAQIGQANQIELSHVAQAEIRSRILLGNLLTEEDYTELCAIYQGQKRSKNSLQRDKLLHKLAIFQYINAHDWFDVNPLLHPLLERWCHGESENPRV